MTQRRHYTEKATDEISSLIADDTSCSSQSSVQKRVDRLRYHRGSLRTYHDLRPTSISFPKKLALLKQKKIFHFWKNLWIARSFQRYKMLTRSFWKWSHLLDHHEEFTHPNYFGESEHGDVSDLSSVSTSHTTLSERREFHSAIMPPNYRQRMKHLPQMKEISQAITELSDTYILDRDDETLTSLSSLNTTDYIRLASQPSLQNCLGPYGEQFDNDSDNREFKLASSTMTTLDFSNSPQPKLHQRISSRIGTLLVHHGNILPTQSTPLRLENSVSSILTSPLYESQVFDPLCSTFPTFASKMTHDAEFRTPPPPPPPLFSHNLKMISENNLFSLQNESFDNDSSLNTCSRMRHLFDRWLSSHRRNFGLRLIAQDHYLKKSFRKVLISLRRITIRRRLGRKELTSFDGITAFRLKRLIWRFIYRIDDSIARRTLCTNSCRTADRLFFETLARSALNSWKFQISKARRRKRNHAKVLLLVLPSLHHWSTLIRKRRERNMRTQKTLQHSIFLRSFRKWKNYFQRILQEIGRNTEIEIRREQSTMMVYFRKLMGNRSQRIHQEQQRASAVYFHQRQVFSKFLSRLRSPGLKRRKMMTDFAPLYFLFLRLRRWKNRCHECHLQKKTDRYAHQFHITRRKRMFIRIMTELVASRRKARILKSSTLALSPPFSRHARTSLSKVHSLPSPSLIPVDIAYDRAEKWFYQRLLLSCHEFFQRLRRMVSRARHRTLKYSRTVTSNYYGQSIQLSHRRSQHFYLESKELFLTKKHNRMVLLDSFIAWLTFFRAVRHRRQILLRRGMLNYLQYCTRHAVAAQLLRFGDKYISLRRKRIYLRYWRKVVSLKSAPLSSRLDVHLETDFPSSSSRPPIHPEGLTLNSSRSRRRVDI